MRKVFTFIAALLTLGISGALMAQQIGSVRDGYIVEGDLLRAGNVLKAFTIPASAQDPSVCMKACEGDEDCNAFSVVQETPKSKPTCLLRMIANPRQTTRKHGYTTVISGTKVDFIREVMNMRGYPGFGVTGINPVKTVGMAKEDPIACAHMCWRDGSCTSFTYAPPQNGRVASGATCSIYAAGGQLASKSQAGFLTGSKQQLSTASSRPTLPSRINPRPTPTLTPRVQGNASLPALQRAAGDDAADDDDAPDSFPGEMLDPPE